MGGKSSEKPAAEKQEFAGLEEANQLAAESLLDLVNSDVKVLKVTPTQSNPFLKAPTMQSVVTSPDAVTPLKRINTKRRQPYMSSQRRLFSCCFH